MKPKALISRFAIATSCILLSSCASTSGVLPLGPDTYTVTGKSEFGSDRAKKAAINEANEFASDKGLHMIPVSVQTGSEKDFVGDRIFTYELTFRVVSRDDPEYERTNLEPVADVVIEDRRNGDSASTSGDYQRLRELKALLDEGVITQAEYQREKDEILGENGD